MIIFVNIHQFAVTNLHDVVWTTCLREALNLRSKGEKK